MVISIRKVIQFIQMWVLIIISTVVLYQAMHIVHTFLWQADLYKVPQGQSVKVHASGKANDSVPWYTNDIKRIEQFFVTGE